MGIDKNALMVQSVAALAQGCAGIELSDEACSWFHERYYAWIDKKSAHPDGEGKSPMEVWDKHGLAFKGKFKSIGALAAKDSSGSVQPDVLEKHAFNVERASECPWCPEK